MTTPIIAANWKMHKTRADAVAFASRLVKDFADCRDRRIIIAPPFTALAGVAEVLKGSPVGLAAQNLSDHESGAFTGEVSAPMLSDAGCEYVIVGHSERRRLFGESHAQINRKLIMALGHGLTPLFCIGETEEQRASSLTFDTITEQINEGLINISPSDIRNVVFAYEPLWAIGTGKTATPGQAQEVHHFIKEMVADRCSIDNREDIPVIYGGSVNERTIGELMAQEDIDGALVGGASLDVESFMRIIRFR